MRMRCTNNKSILALGLELLGSVFIVPALSWWATVHFARRPAVGGIGEHKLLVGGGGEHLGGEGRGMEE